MNDLQIFENKEFGKVRTIKSKNDIWFAAKDICDILDLSNSRKALSNLDNDEVSKLKLRRYVW